MTNRLGVTVLMAVGFSATLAMAKESEERSKKDLALPGVATPVAEGRYLISLRPGRADFTYHFDVRNPNPSEQPFEVKLRSGEVVQHAEGAETVESGADSYSFLLPPGDARITLKGALPDPKFTPPLESGVQYLLVEAHPLLRVTLPDSLRRISPGETGLTADFRGAQAFLLNSGDTAAWEARTVDLLQSTSFAVPRSAHDFYLNGDGDALGDTVLEIQNEGASDLSLPMKGTPAAASVDGATVPLAKNAAGNFWTQLSVGVQQVGVQYWQSLRNQLGFAWGTLWLPEVPASVTETTVNVHYPAEWTPLYQRFHGDTRVTGPADGHVALAAFLGVWALLIASLLRLPQGRAFAFVTASALSAFAAPWAVTVVMGCLGVLSMIWLRNRIDSVWSAVKFTGSMVPAVAVAAAGLFVIAIVLTSVFGQDMRVMYGAATQSMVGVSSIANHVTIDNSGYKSKSLTQFGTDREDDATNSKNGPFTTYMGYKGASPPTPAFAPAPAIHRADYVGLSARTEPPAGMKWTGFRAEMLRAGGASGVEVLLVSTWMIKLAELLLGLLILVILARERSALWLAAERLTVDRRPQVTTGLVTPVPAM